MPYFLLEPSDTLFFRDGRPFETAGGHGARWPEPSVIFDALHAALHRAFPDLQDWEHAHTPGRNGQKLEGAGRGQRFGSLATAGLFPVWRDGSWLFPAPADFVHGQRLRLIPAQSSNLPKFLTYVAANFEPPSKDEGGGWWTSKAWESFLASPAANPAGRDRFTNAELFTEEWHTGIGMDANTGTQDGERIYSAEYLRLRHGVRAGFVASLRMKQGRDATKVEEQIERMFAADRCIVVGGQQRVCRVEARPAGLPCPLPAGPVIEGTRVRWTLLTPAIWPKCVASEHPHPGGWLPNWIDAKSGRVLLRLRSGALRRVWSEKDQRMRREAERDEPIDAQLVAVCAGKPVPIVGWTERLHLQHEMEKWRKDESSAHGPRPTHLAVPAGSVYYFEADSAEEARKLAEALNWHGSDIAGGEIRHRRSTLLGEKGFGLGVCGTWAPEVPGAPSAGASAGAGAISPASSPSPEFS